MAALRINQDFHIHTHHSCDLARATMDTIIHSMEKFGIEHYGISDHLHTQYNLCDIQSSRNDFFWFKPPPNFHFGIEVTCVAQSECERIARKDYVPWGDEPIYGLGVNYPDEPFDGRMAIGISQKDIDELGIEYVIGGVHINLGAPKNHREHISGHFLQQKFLLEHPLVDILAHPWSGLEITREWYFHREAKNIDWSVYEEIPQSYNDELAEIALKNHKLIEINGRCLYHNPPYSGIMKKIYQTWKKQGIHFTFGSDLHDAAFPPDQYSRAEKILSDWGFTDDDFALPPRLKQA